MLSFVYAKMIDPRCEKLTGHEMNELMSSICVMSCLAFDNSSEQTPSITFVQTHTNTLCVSVFVFVCLLPPTCPGSVFQHHGLISVVTALQGQGTDSHNMPSWDIRPKTSIYIPTQLFPRFPILHYIFYLTLFAM